MSLSAISIIKEEKEKTRRIIRLGGGKVNSYDYKQLKREHRCFSSANSISPLIIIKSPHAFHYSPFPWH